PRLQPNDARGDVRLARPLAPRQGRWLPRRRARARDRGPAGPPLLSGWPVAAEDDRHDPRVCIERGPRAIEGPPSRARSPRALAVGRGAPGPRTGGVRRRPGPGRPARGPAGREIRSRRVDPPGPAGDYPQRPSLRARGDARARDRPLPPAGG